MCLFAKNHREFETLYLLPPCDIMILRSRGEIGRRVGFRFRWETVWVQVPSAAPAQLPADRGEFLFATKGLSPCG